jgi:hypothetical protein
MSAATEHHPGQAARRLEVRSLAVLAIHAIVFVALAMWSWRKWPDPLVDFGRELYLSWQIDRGHVLYRDLASLFGPLSPYVNALWFRLFGPSLLTLALCNLAILAATVVGLYHLIRVSTDRITATAVGLATLLLFGFSQYVPVGNYNFVTPYSHGATHGIALSVAMLALLHHALRTLNRGTATLAGVCFGLALLTKPEIGAAATAAALVAWSAAGALGGRDRSNLRSSLPLFVVAAAAPSLAFFFYFNTLMSTGQSVRAIAGAWVPLVGTGIAANDFYRHSAGLDAPIANAVRMAATFAGFLAFVAAAAAISWNADASRRASTLIRILRVCLLAATILVLRYVAFARALPLIVLTALLASSALFVRRRGDRERAVAVAPLMTCAALALVLLGKMALNARIEHYGFYLALPAMAVTIVLVSWMVPQFLASFRSDAAGRSFRQLALWALAVAIAPYLGLAHGWNRSKSIPIGDGADRFYASALPGQWQGRALQDVLTSLKGLAAPGDTLAVLPEGVMVNYLTRLDSPLPVVNLMPPELLAFGQDEILRALIANAPDFVVLIQRDTSEYGYPPFGTDRRYGLEIVRWLRAHYEDVRIVGRQPTGGSDVHVQLLKRTPSL